jgi:hypothetical protein
VSDQANTVIPFFMVVWLLFGVGGQMYIRSRPSAAESAASIAFLTVLSGVFFAGLVLWTAETAAMFMLPMIAFIPFLNLRNTHFCGHCGKVVHAQPFQRTEFCPRCGAALKHHAGPGATRR